MYSPHAEPEKTPAHILMWVVGVIILLSLLSPLSCHVNLQTSPSVHDDANAVTITECEFGTVTETPELRIITAPDGTTIGVVHKW